jgi:hypothetical protein
VPPVRSRARAGGRARDPPLWSTRTRPAPFRLQLAGPTASRCRWSSGRFRTPPHRRSPAPPCTCDPTAPPRRPPASVATRCDGTSRSVPGFAVTELFSGIRSAGRRSAGLTIRQDRTLRPVICCKTPDLAPVGSCLISVKSVVRIYRGPLVAHCRTHDLERRRSRTPVVGRRRSAAVSVESGRMPLRAFWNPAGWRDPPRNDCRLPDSLCSRARLRIRRLGVLVRSASRRIFPGALAAQGLAQPVLSHLDATCKEEAISRRFLPQLRYRRQPSSQGCPPSASESPSFASRGPGVQRRSDGTPRAEFGNASRMFSTRRSENRGLLEIRGTPPPTRLRCCGLGSS